MNFLQSMVEGKGDKAIPEGQGLGMAVKAEVPVQLLQSPSLQREKAKSLDTLTGNSLRSHYYSYYQSSEKSLSGPRRATSAGVAQPWRLSRTHSCAHHHRPRLCPTSQQLTFAFSQAGVKYLSD